jgi:hypothetical protein
VVASRDVTVYVHSPDMVRYTLLSLLTLTAEWADDCSWYHPSVIWLHSEALSLMAGRLRLGKSKLMMAAHWPRLPDCMALQYARWSASSILWHVIA